MEVWRCPGEGAVDFNQTVNDDFGELEDDEESRCTDTDGMITCVVGETGGLKVGVHQGSALRPFLFADDLQ